VDDKYFIDGLEVTYSQREETLKGSDQTLKYFNQNQKVIQEIKQVQEKVVV